MSRRFVAIRRVFVLALLALLPALLLVGGGGTVTAGVPPTTPTTLQQGARPEAFVLRVYFRDNAERDRLAEELGAEEAPTAGGYITVIADRDMYNSLLARGQRFDVDQAATRELNTPIVWGHNADTFYGGYYTVEEVQTFLDQKVAAYPGLAEKVDIGDSWCKTHPGACTLPEPNNGYEIYALRITNRSIPGPKPVFWFNAGLHAREIVPPEVGIRYINTLLDGYASDADARWLVDWHDVWVVVIHNPDGHHIVEAGNPPYLHRKNGDRDDGCTTWPPSSSNHFGVDLNRNFPYKWNYCTGCSSGAPCNQTYRGPAENSEEETQAMVAKVREVIPDQRGPGDDDAAPLDATGVYLDMHSYGRYNLYPYGWTTTRQAPNHNDLDNLAQHMRATNAGPPGNNYTSCQAGPCFYATDGASDDWEYGELGAPSFTTEVGNSFTPQYTEVEAIWNENRGMLRYLAKVARAPYLLARGPDTNVVATNPMTVTQGTPSLLSATINYNWTGNRYIQNVGGAEYYIDTPPWAGGAPVAMQASDGAFDSPTEGVQATIDTANIPPGLHVIFVRGRGVSDYGGLGSWGPVSAAFLTVTGGGSTPTATRTPTPVAPTATPRFVTPGPTQICISMQDTISQADPVQVGMLNQVGTPSLCHWPPYRGCTVLADTQPRHYKLYRYYFPVGSFSTQCVTVQLNPTGCAGNVYSVAYVANTGSEPFDPNNICLNYAGDPGVVAQGSSQYTFFVFRGRYFDIVVHEVGPNTGCSAYTLTISTNIPCNYISLPTPSPTSSFTRTPTRTTTPTNTPVIPPTLTSFPSTATLTTPLATNTASAATNTSIATTSTSTALPPPPTPTTCPLTFTDVPSNHTFYSDIRCLACRGVLGGYLDGTFKPQNNITRGQIAKVVSNAALFNDPVSGQTYQDVPPSQTFYEWIERLSTRGVMGGYPCGGTGEPCMPGNRPYFRPGQDATRGQLSKIVANAAQISDPVSGQFYTDVGTTNPFYTEIMRLTGRGVMSGYACGGTGEPCDAQNRPYFRWGANVTRGQASKIVANTFYPGCQTP